MDSEIIIRAVFAALAFAAAAAAFKLDDKKAEPARKFEEAALAESAEALAKAKDNQLNIFFEICETTNFLQGVRNFRNYGYDEKPGILVACTSRYPNLPPFLEKIKGISNEELLTLQLSKDEMETVEAIVLQTIGAACLGLISKSKGSLKIDDALSHIKGEIEVGYYWSVVAHSMAEVKIVCGEETMYRTFFEQKMMESV